MTATARKQTFTSQTTSSNVTPLRKATTLEMTRLCCPTAIQIESIQNTFGVDCQDGGIIRETVEANLLDQMDMFKGTMNERALEIHFQRVVGAYVGSAYGSGQFYGKAVSEAREATSKLANDLRDEDREGPAGFDSEAQRKRDFAATLAVQAFQLLMAAEGAAGAYQTFFGEAWKPYENHQTPATGSSVGRKAASLQMSAFG